MTKQWVLMACAVLVLGCAQMGPALLFKTMEFRMKQGAAY
jgi:hypothetical protein